MEDGHLLLQVLLLIILIGINAFFASSEVALISLKPASVRKLAEESARGRQLAALVGNSGRFLATVQIGVTFAGFMASALAAESFAGPVASFLAGHGFSWIHQPTLNAAVIVFITAALSYISLVFGELVPKQLGLRYAENIALHASGIINFLARIAMPLVWMLNASVNGMLQLMGIDAKRPQEVTEEEIRMMVDLGEESGNIESDERRMIENVFEFSNTTAGEVMTHRTEMVAINIDASPEEVEQTLMDCGFTRVPVYRDNIDDVIGMLHFREYFSAKLNGDAAPDVSKLLTPVYFAPETMRANLLFRNMQNKKFGMAVILDEFGGTSGIVTIEDLLEEIVGSLYDEFDDDGDAAKKLADNIWLLDGATRLDELAKLLDMPEELPEADYDTIGGLIFSRLNAVPTAGAKIELPEYGLAFEVESVQERRADKIKVVYTPPLPPQEDGISE